ncbi:ATP-binding protein [Lentzea flava]|uniref:ATPase AAA n=1 Tax=Lentzea flava TaxID=103732 RepID=A0ABQ2UHY5_9PSEU|nr:DUF4143 domain-containing protein [Lentzea flava]MCP2199550.1 hypothetical protein [Lentzea flava]GGU37337.1 ATPase AAA [Lentzea flava]
MSSDYVPRLTDQLIGDLLADFPALLVLGPRAVGKTTTAARHARTILRLDQPRVAAALEADPDAALLNLEEPVLIDEWQLVPSVLGAIKRSVDADSSPGRFIITGSVHGDLDHQTWPGTGRLLRVDMSGLTVRELDRRPLDTSPFLDRVRTGTFSSPADAPDLRGYLDLAVRGGFPQLALRDSEQGRRRWARTYLDELFTRDVEQLDGGRAPRLLRRYFQTFAANTSGVVTDKTIFEAAGVSRNTAIAYEKLLSDLYIVDIVPAWHTNRLKRLVKLPKRYVVDTGLVSAALGVGVDAVMLDGDLIGRLLDTFVAAQLRAELQLGERDAVLYHLRDANGSREVDLLIEFDDGRVIACEIKATGAPRKEHAKHLTWLRDELGDRFVAGIVFHTGPRMFQLDERVSAVPICAIWHS